MENERVGGHRLTSTAMFDVYTDQIVLDNLFVLINYFFFYKMEQHQDERESTSQNSNLVPWHRI